MRCPKCVEEGLKSTVYVGVSMTTLMATHSWYDEDGIFHYHNPNKTTTEYSCSNGHRWTE